MRHRERERKDEYLTGIIAATIANWSMGAPETPKLPRDFALPLLRLDDKGRVRTSRPRINRKKIAADIRDSFTQAIKRLGPTQGA